ncbi:MAG TPA: hypothetical protein PKC18_14660 [Lacipirellulaceae bacterium]|nr:hypothetical protein [Lacipirellulaceae bacterium]
MQFATTGSLRRAASAATVLSLWAAHIEIAKAQQFVSWVQPAGGNYSDSANWSPSVVPGANDSAFFDLNATYRVNLGNTSISEAYFRRGVVTLELTNFTYVVRSATAALNVYGGAPGQTATVVVRGGQIHADTLGDDVIIGLGLGTGTLRLDNANLGGAAAATRPDLFVGRSGTGTLIADGRSVLTLNTFTVADWSELGIGTATLTGPLVRLDAATGTIGNGGDATVALEQGAQATFTGALTIASQSTSESTLTLTESQLTAGQFVVGNSGFGGFFVNAGSEIAVTETQIGTLASGVGQAAISGSGSRWTTGGMRVGLAGRGELRSSPGPRPSASRPADAAR